MSSAAAARTLLERDGHGPVISLYFDLDPERFATAPARATQARSLIDAAHRSVRERTDLGHEQRTRLGEDIAALDEWLGSDELPVEGQRALAIFRAGEELFETLGLSRPTEGRVVIAHTPYVEPLVTDDPGGPLYVALVDSDSARLFSGDAHGVRERSRVREFVHGRHHSSRYRSGGPPADSLQHTVDSDREAHLRTVAADIYRDWQRLGFETLVLGGTEQNVDGLRAALHNDLRPTLLDARLALDLSAVSDADVAAAVEQLAGARLESAHGGVLARFSEALAAARSGNASPARAVAGCAATLEALAERRVETLLLGRDFHAAGARCPRCGMPLCEDVSTCPADGTPVTPVPDLRETAVETAVLQDADVVAFDEPVQELPPGKEIGALLRF